MGLFDVWHNLNPSQRLEKALNLLQTYIPRQFERCKRAVLTDNQATLVGSYTPVVRHPIIRLPCGKSALGIGDIVVLNDPIAGQGANNAIKAADLYAKEIQEHGEKPFDERWMHDTFEQYWKFCGKWATKWSHLLLMPPAPHVVALLSAASRSQPIANLLADGFDDPSSLFPWIMHPDDTLKIIQEIEQSQGTMSSKDGELSNILSPDPEISKYAFRP